jgi:hypothetical protein
MTPMLRIRPEQIEAFASPDTPHFESSAIIHIKRAFPKHFSVLQDSGALAVVNHARTHARRYGLNDADAVRLNFDQDVQLPWAAAILNDRSLPGHARLDVIEPQPLVKSVRLHEHAMAYLDEVSGVENEHIDAAQRRLLDQPFSVAAQEETGLEQEALQRLSTIWPEKYNYLGPDGALTLVRYGIGRMQQYGVSTPLGAFLGIVTMYMLGTGFDQDPLFPWAGRILNDQQLNPSERTTRLYEEGITYLKMWCATC